MDAGEPWLWKYADELRLRLRALEGTGTRVRLGWMQDPEDEPEWEDWQEVEMSYARTFWRLGGPYLVVEIETTALGDHFALGGFEIWGTQDGREP